MKLRLKRGSTSRSLKQWRRAHGKTPHTFWASRIIQKWKSWASVSQRFNQSANNSWSTVTGRIRAQARDAYYRDLCLVKRILYVHNFLLAKAWYNAQIFALPENCKRQVNTAIVWYLWHGDIFRVPLPTPQRRKQQGGWDLIHVAVKSRALLYYRL